MVLVHDGSRSRKRPQPHDWSLRLLFLKKMTVPLRQRMLRNHGGPVLVTTVGATAREPHLVNKGLPCLPGILVGRE